MPTKKEPTVKKALPALPATHAHVVKKLAPPDLSKFPEGEWQAHVQGIYDVLNRIVLDIELPYDCCRHGGSPEVAAIPFKQWKEQGYSALHGKVDEELRTVFWNVPNYMARIPDLYTTLRLHEKMVRDIWGSQYIRLLDRLKQAKQKAAQQQGRRPQA